MEHREKFRKVHFLLLALTLMFLGALTWFTLHDGTVDEQDGYRISVERSVPSAELVPEKKRIDINTASASELEGLMGIGPALAQAIVDYRAEHGPFASVEELLEVSGIGEGKLDGIRNDVTVGGEDEG